MMKEIRLGIPSIEIKVRRIDQWLLLIPMTNYKRLK